MRKAIGLLIVLWGMSHFLSQSFIQLDKTGAQSFKTIETAALVAEIRLTEK